MKQYMKVTEYQHQQPQCSVLVDTTQVLASFFKDIKRKHYSIYLINKKCAV